MKIPIGQFGETDPENGDEMMTMMSVAEVVIEITVPGEMTPAIGIADGLMILLT
jgi:hypothetical protein